MSEIFRVPSFHSINLKEQTTLDADAVIGANSVIAFNAGGFVVGDKLQVGNPGSDNGELMTVQSISGKTITFTTTLTNKHLRSEALIQLLGDQVKLYRSPNVTGYAPADSSFVYVIASTIQGDDATVDVVDSTSDAGSGYWYKTTYFNSGTSVETSLALSVAVRGANYGHLASLDVVRREAGLFDNRTIDDSIIAARRSQAESEVLGKLGAAGYLLPLQTATGIPYVPPVVENITVLLAAGYLLLQDYGAVAAGDTKDGAGKIDRASKLIREIQEQENILQDITGTQLARTLQISGWPDNTTASVGTDGVTGEPFPITMSTRF